MFAIFRRELRSYFTSPIAYIYIAVFYALASFYFFGTALLSNSTNLSYVFSYLFTISMFLIPILTMRLLSEDKKYKTDQALLTAPISLLSLVLGKYLAALFVYFIGIAITLVFGVIIAAFTPPDWAVIFGHFIGLLLLGAALIAIGTFIASLTENQVIAAVGGFAVGFALMLVEALTSVVQSPLLQSIISGISFTSRYQSFTVGVLNFADVIFFLSVCVVFIFFTVRVFEKRRWS